MTAFEDVKAKVLQIITNYAFNKQLVADATDDSRIIADLKINSARIVDIILDIEDQYHIEIEDAAVEKMVKVSDAINIILNKING
jgi:acyl carrier protein